MRLIVSCLALALGVAGCSTGPSRPVATVLSSSTEDAAVAARMISEYRVANGLSPVKVDATLNAAAEAQAREVAAAGKLSHGNFSARMYRFNVHGAAAENLTAGSDNVATAITRWKNSPGHHQNLLMREARHIGLARANTNSQYRSCWALVLRM